MKAFVYESLEKLGGIVREAPGGGLRVSVPGGSRAEALLDTGTDHLLYFSLESAAPDALNVVPGSRILDGLSLELSKDSSRHGLLPDSAKLSRKQLKDMYTVFFGKVAKFSVRSSWRTTVRCHFKITIVGDELMEELLCVEVPFKGLPRFLEDVPVLKEDVRWVVRPPLKQYQFREMLDQGMAFSEKIAMDRANDSLNESLKRLYSTLDRLKCYYQQVKEESVQGEPENKISAAEEEYQRRKTEEIQQARVRAKVEVIAVETLSVPVKRMTWKLKKKDGFRDAQAVFNCFDGKVVEPVQCEICLIETETFGIAGPDKIVCPDCFTQCDICEAEIMRKNAGQSCSCITCGRHACEEHSGICNVCREPVCAFHLLDCKEGCSVCGSCARYCVECGYEVVWCRDHSLMNSNHSVTCHSHAVYCVGCKEPHPASNTDTCSSCGQTVCFNCQMICEKCKRLYCVNHFGDGGCFECLAEMEKKEKYQMRLF
ncbi:hypothetical protein ACFL03_07860 [Thermodesulfobacteriota bacterium]